MKRTSILLLMLSLLAASCQKYEDSDLLGQWQLLEMTRTDDGVAVSKKAGQITWSFQLGLLQVRALNEETGSVGDVFLGLYSEAGDSLFIPATYFHYRDRDSLYTDPAQTILEPYGIKGNTARFAIEVLSSNTLQLSSAFCLLRFRKF